jgi:hypothetical protein
MLLIPDRMRCGNWTAKTRRTGWVDHLLTVMWITFRLTGQMCDGQSGSLFNWQMDQFSLDKYMPRKISAKTT